MHLVHQPVAAFSNHLKKLGVRRAYFVFDTESKRVRPSDASLQPIADALLDNRRDFHEHEAVFLEAAPSSTALFGAFLHKTIRGQGAGGVRHWGYATLNEFLTDGLRLSQGMGRKNALAGLWWGGGKGVIAKDNEAANEAQKRQQLYREYGRFITSLRGAYVTAEDAGTGPMDMAEIFGATRFVTCIPPELGGSGNPSYATSKGVVSAMQAALEFVGLGGLRDRTVAMQGVGNVGESMISDLLEAGVRRVIAADISEQKLQRARARFADAPVELRHATSGDTSIFAEKCDLFAPNALGGVLSPETIPLLACRVVCGAANNQLLDDQRDDQVLAKRGITYVPDFVCNRMGIVHCANEQYGVMPNDPAIYRHFDPQWDNSVFVITRRVLARSRDESITSTQAANRLADELALEPHPLWGHRTAELIRSLVEDEWHLREAGHAPAEPSSL